MYLLATGERTFGAAKQLIASGESVDQRDNAQINALAYALQARDYEAALRLLRLGARPDATVSFDEIPVAMLPVLTRDPEGIRSLQRAGVDFSKVRYRGISALEYAKQTGDRRLIDALDPRGRAI
jgi:ankyrin repeat protein